MNQSNSSRDRILGVLRANRPHMNPAPRPDSYLPVTLPTDADLVARFTAELERLTGKVYRPLDSAGAVAQVLALIGDDPSVLVSDNLPLPGLSDAFAARGIRAVVPNIKTNTRAAALQAVEPIRVGITGALAGLASTGTLVLSTALRGARIASLLPQVHIALLSQTKLYPNLEGWLAVDGRQTVLDTCSVYFITGPSRTSDIEMQTILGVHGPGEVHVILLP